MVSTGSPVSRREKFIEPYHLEEGEVVTRFLWNSKKKNRKVKKGEKAHRRERRREDVSKPGENSGAGNFFFIFLALGSKEGSEVS